MKVLKTIEGETLARRINKTIDYTFKFMSYLYQHRILS